MAIGAVVVAGSAALPGSGLDRGIEVMASIIVIRRSLGPGWPERRAQQLMAVSFFPLAPCGFIPSPVPQPHGSGPWADRLGLAWGDG